MSTSRAILVCQNRTCRRQGSAKVLATFRQYDIADFEVQPSGCLGQCGNGPMVLILPEEIWYCGVQPQEVSLVVKQHLQGGKPVASMLYRKFHCPN